MTIEELKIRQLTNQYLLDPSDKMTVIHDLCGVQAQFFPNAMHSSVSAAAIGMKLPLLRDW